MYIIVNLEARDTIDKIDQILDIADDVRKAAAIPRPDRRQPNSWKSPLPRTNAPRPFRRRP